MTTEINLADGRYIVTNDNGNLSYKRYGKPWHAANSMMCNGLLLAMVQRIEELEAAYDCNTAIMHARTKAMNAGSARIEELEAASVAQATALQDVMRQVRPVLKQQMPVFEAAMQALQLKSEKS